LQYADTRDDENPPSAPPLVIWQGGSFVAQTGSSLFGPHAFSTRRLQVGDSVSWITGGHSMKAGADVLKDRNAVAFGPLTTLGFQTIARAAAGSRNGSSDWFVQTLETGTVHPDANQYAAFLQDAWRLTPALTMDLGVRYDIQDFLANDINTGRDNWAPRVGVAYARANAGRCFVPRTDSFTAQRRH
jgi:outer membrane receptor protein involved in Fe transport